MYKGTTPTILLRLPEGTDLTGATVYVTLSDEQENEIITTTDVTIDDNVISLYLTQAQTLALPKRVLIQVNMLYGSRRDCTKKVSIDTQTNLIPHELP